MGDIMTLKRDRKKEKIKKEIRCREEETMGKGNRKSRGDRGDQKWQS